MALKSLEKPLRELEKAFRELEMAKSVQFWPNLAQNGPKMAYFRLKSAKKH